MKKPTIEQIHRVMIKSGMKVFKRPFSVTLGGIRTKDNKANTFNDWLFSSYYDEVGKIHAVIIPGTVDAGLTYRINPINPEGTAIIQDGVQHMGVYQYQNPILFPSQLGHNGKEAFRQIKPMDCWRDNDHNIFIGLSDQMPDFSKLPTEKSISFTNGHDMGQLGKNVNNWSAGCWGSTESKMDALYAQAKKQVKHGLGDIFSYALLNENMF